MRHIFIDKYLGGGWAAVALTLIFGLEVWWCVLFAGLLWGNCILAMKNRQKNPDERTGSRYIIEMLMSRTQKLKGLVAASL